MGGWVVNATPRPLYQQKRPGTHCIGGWVGLKASLARCGKSHPHRHSIRGPSSPQPVAIPTELSRLLSKIKSNNKTNTSQKVKLKCRPLFSNCLCLHNLIFKNSDTWNDKRTSITQTVVLPHSHSWLATSLSYCVCPPPNAKCTKLHFALYTEQPKPYCSKLQFTDVNSNSYFYQNLFQYEINF